MSLLGFEARGFVVGAFCGALLMLVVLSAVKS